MVLQDLINELGRRLDYQVTNGRYQGTVNSIGHDGIWLSPEGHTIIAEVKTTDAYRISLDTIAGYKYKLIDAGRASHLNLQFLSLLGGRILANLKRRFVALDTPGT